MRNRSPANSDGFVAAGAGADFEDDVALVHRVLGQQRELELLLELLALVGCSARRSVVRQLAHLGVGRGVGDQRLEIGELGRDAAIGLDPARPPGRVSANSRDSLTKVVAADNWSRQLGLDRRVAGEQGVELVFRQRRSQLQAFGGGEAASSRSRIEPPAAGSRAAADSSAAAFLASRSSSIALTGPIADGDSDSER